MDESVFDHRLIVVRSTIEKIRARLQYLMDWRYDALIAYQYEVAYHEVYLYHGHVLALNKQVD
jgi:hypothetical protein